MPECSLNFVASIRVDISFANAAIAFAFLLIGWPLVMLACYHCCCCCFLRFGF